MPRAAKPSKKAKQPLTKSALTDPQIIPKQYRLSVDPGSEHRHLACRLCGSDTVAWQQSMKTGKYYLTEVFLKMGEKFTGRLEFHSKYCGKPELHEEMQIQYGIEAEEELGEV